MKTFTLKGRTMQIRQWAWRLIVVVAVVALAVAFWQAWGAQ